MEGGKDKTHLYVHIPYCHRICPYCSFYKHKPGQIAQRAFVEALGREAQLRAGQMQGIEPLTMYLGGGTPSILGGELFKRLVELLAEAFDLCSLQEFCLEANPMTFNERKASVFRECGVTRVSLGVQSFKPDELLALGRDHTPEGVVKSFRILRGLGFRSLNIDLMFCVPGQSERSWRDTLERTLDLRPDHISAYNLTYEQDTEYFRRYSQGEYQDDAERNARLFTLANELLTSAGYEHYETSNYALVGHRSLHNQAYWMGENYLGLGPSAVSTHDGLRWKNVSDTAAYVQLLGRGECPIAERETLDSEAWRLERIALQLRTIEGLPLEFLPEAGNYADIVGEGLAYADGGRLRLTESGALLVDEIAAYLV